MKVERQGESQGGFQGLFLPTGRAGKLGRQDWCLSPTGSKFDSCFTFPLTDVACKATEMSFQELFDHLHLYIRDCNLRWKYVMRVKRGLQDANDVGGYGKDQCYFKGQFLCHAYQNEGFLNFLPLWNTRFDGSKQQSRPFHFIPCVSNLFTMAGQKKNCDSCHTPHPQLQQRYMYISYSSILTFFLRGVAGCTRIARRLQVVHPRFIQFVS